MSKTISSIVNTYLESGRLVGAYIAKLHMGDSNYVRVTNAGNPVYWDEGLGGADFKFNAVGQLGSISPMDESNELRAYNITLNLSGIPDEFISYMLGPDYKNKKATVWLAVFDDDHTVLADPIKIFSGRMDTANMNIGGNNVLSINVASKFADWETPHGGRFNHAYQITYIDANDQGFEYVPQLEDIEIIWGRGGAGTRLTDPDRSTRRAGGGGGPLGGGGGLGGGSLGGGGGALLPGGGGGGSFGGGGSPTDGFQDYYDEFINRDIIGPYAG